jgi:hypothetical protein
MDTEEKTSKKYLSQHTRNLINTSKEKIKATTITTHFIYTENPIPVIFPNPSYISTMILCKHAMGLITSSSATITQRI